MNNEVDLKHRPGRISGKGWVGGHIRSTYKLNPAFAISTFPIIHFVCVFLASNTRKQFCMRIVFTFSSEFQLSREKCKQCVCKTACVCWGTRNTQTKWKCGNGELSSYQHAPPPLPQSLTPLYFSRKTRFEPVAVDLTAKEAREMFFFLTFIVANT